MDHILKDEDILGFGLYTNYNVNEISKINPMYLLWLCKPENGYVFRLTDKMERELRLKSDENIVNNFMKTRKKYERKIDPSL